MTLRFPRTEPLIPDGLRDRLIDNGRVSEERDGFDAERHHPNTASS